jgi:hypothetical protein
VTTRALDQVSVIRVSRACPRQLKNEL